MTPNFPQDFEKCVYSPENIKTLFPVLFHFRLVPITTRFLHVDFTSTTIRYTRNIHTYLHALSKLNRSIIRKIFCQNFDHPDIFFFFHMALIIYNLTILKITGKICSFQICISLLECNSDMLIHKLCSIEYYEIP